MVPLHEGNEARRDGRRGIGAPHTTGEAGESGPRNPVEGRGRRQIDPLEGTMANTPRLDSVSPKRQRIAELAGQAPEMVFTSLAHYIDMEFLRAAYAATRKDGAVGLDGQTADDDAAHLEVNLQSLLDRFKSGRYQPPRCVVSTSPRGMAGRLDRSGFRRSRIRCCSVRSRWCWRVSMSRTSWIVASASVLGARLTRPSRSSGTRRWRCEGGGGGPGYPGLL